MAPRACALLALALAAGGVGAIRIEAPRSGSSLPRALAAGAARARPGLLHRAAGLRLRGGCASAGARDGAARSEAGRALRRQLTVLLVAMALFNDMLQLSMLTPIIPSLIASPPPLGVRSNGEVAMGLLFASKDICQLSAAPLAGLFIARYSSRLALFASTLGLGVATIMMAEGTTFNQLLVARGCQGAASAAIMSGGLSLIAETQPAHSRGRSLAMAYTGLAMGVLSGPLVGGLLFERLGRRRTFYLAGSVVLINALAQMPLLFDANLPALGEKPPDKAPHAGAAAYLRLLSHPHVLAVMFVCVCVYV